MTNVGTHLRLITTEDAATLAAIVTASAEHLRPFQPARKPDFYTESGQYRRIESALQSAASGQSAPFVIESANGEILGELTLSGITYGAFRSCAMGYWIRADQLRRGHATTAVGLAIQYAFNVLKLHRVQAETLPENKVSKTILANTGFTYFGTAPAYLRINGAWREHQLFQLINPS